ncbi:MAG TPA: HdeD family acid-resistance protein [Solirubrobacteraceae bacterium]|nr:HdeD family acid-resistance protein [Solirubrobacteraceae bacterium]
MSGQTLAREDLHEATWAWWLFMLVGLLSIAAGVIVLAKPDDSLSTLAVVAGIFVLVDGIFDLAASFGRHTENRGLVAVMGVLDIVIGVLLIRHPIGGVLAIALLIGIWLIAAGLLRLVGAFEREQRVWNIAIAVLEVVAGIVIVSSPPIGFATLALLVGISFIANGVATFALGWMVHSLRHDLEGPAFDTGVTA